MRDDILFWALSHDNYKRYWLEHDTPIGCDLPLLPEAGGDTRTLEPAAAREANHTTQRRRLDGIMASNDPANEEHKQIISHVRRARALYMT
eukprot:2014886-Pyramimonas_sp.AAC.1